MQDRTAQVPAINRDSIRAWSNLARQTHDEWDRAETGLRTNIHAQGLAVLCQSGCVPCCCSHKQCSVSEAAAIVDWVDQNLDPATAEQLRLRVASAASSIARLRSDGLMTTPDALPRTGGMECPFLHRGTCAVYPSRPLDCHAQMATVGQDREQCFACPENAGPPGAMELGRQFVSQLDARENAAGIALPTDWPRRALVAEQVGYL